MPSLYSHSETGSEKGRKAREEEISWETLGWLTPPRVQNQPKTFPFGFCLVIHLQLQKLQQLDRRSLSTKWEEATDTLNISLKKGGGAELPRKYFPLLFYPLIFEDHTVPFILASGCLWFEYRNPKAFKWRLPMALIELPSTYIHTHTHTHTHTHNCRLLPKLRSTQWQAALPTFTSIFFGKGFMPASQVKMEFTSMGPQPQHHPRSLQHSPFPSEKKKKKQGCQPLAPKQWRFIEHSVYRT